MPVRKADAVWQGTLKEGSGTVKMAIGEHPYSFSTRFENGAGTNPEELLGAAHAGCYSMALNVSLERAGFLPNKVATTANVHLEKGEAGFGITKIHLVVEADVPNIEEATFMEFATKAKETCIISVALASIPEITLEATLTSN